jgi:hypothetical protein
MKESLIYQQMYNQAEFVQPYLYYYLRFGICPNKLGFWNIDKNKLYDMLMEKFSLSEDKIIKSQDYIHDKEELKHNYVLLEPGDHSLVFFNLNWGCYHEDKLVEIIYSHKTDPGLVKQLKDLVTSCILQHEIKSEIHLICKYDSGLGLNSFEITKKDFDLSMNYNDDFAEIDQIIRERLNKVKDKGIVLLHGMPGTGKTNYIRYLLTTVQKKMIYLPPDLACEIGNPGFLTFLTGNSDSILIIEDAENVIMERSGGSNGAISNLLNLCDGLLSDCLNIQVVCSFNTDISRIDKALMRKGRLIAKYEFKKLSIDKAQRLSDSLGYSSIILKEMCLSEIYNQDQKEFAQPKMAGIGFGRGIEV